MKKLKRMDDMQAALVTIVVLVVIILGLVTFMGIESIIVMYHYSSYDTEVTVRAYDVESEVGHVNCFKNTKSRCSYAYEYDGQIYQGESTWTNARITENQLIRLKFDSSKPENALLEAEATTANQWVCIAGAILLLVMLFFKFA